MTTFHPSPPSEVSVPNKGAFVALNQERVLFAQETAESSKKAFNGDNVYLCLNLRGALDKDALERALHEIVARHSSLRMRIYRNPDISESERRAALEEHARMGLIRRGLYLQTSEDYMEAVIQHRDLRGCSPGEQIREIQAMLIPHPLPLGGQRSLTLHATLCQMKEAEYVLVVEVDHLVSDGWSMTVLRREIESLYRHFAHGTVAPPSLPESGFVDFAQEEMDRFWKNRESKDIVYWDVHWRRFGGARVAPDDFPFYLPDRSRAQQDGEFQSEKLLLRGEELESLRTQIRLLRVTIYVVYLAALLLVLRRYTGLSTLAVWSGCANRAQARYAESIGFYVNMHLMGFELGEISSVRELLQVANSRVMDTLEHEQMPLQYLWHTLRSCPRARDSGITLGYRAEPPDTAAPAGQVQFSKTGIEYPLVGRAASFGFYLLDSGDSLRFSADFVAQLYHPQGVREMLEDVNRVALAIAKNPNANVNDIAKFASYYGIAEKPPRPDMSEYIVSGANSLPALKLSTIET